jgi:hypothetical protein
MSREHAYGFAKVAIQSVFLLNGGALIAFPAFAQLVGTGLREHIGFAVGGILSWVVGVALAARATKRAFDASDAIAAAYGVREDYIRKRLGEEAFAREGKRLMAGADEARKQQDKTYRQGELSMIRAFDLVNVALFAFIVGAFCAALVFTGLEYTQLLGYS